MDMLIRPFDLGEVVMQGDVNNGCSVACNTNCSFCNANCIPGCLANR